MPWVTEPRVELCGQALRVEITASDSRKKRNQKQEMGDNDKEQNINIPRQPDYGQDSQAAPRRRLFINPVFTRRSGLNRHDEKRTNMHVQRSCLSILLDLRWGSTPEKNKQPR